MLTEDVCWFGFLSFDHRQKGDSLGEHKLLNAFHSSSFNRKKALNRYKLSKHNFKVTTKQETT